MSIAKKYAKSYMPNGEVSLEQVIQAAIDEATEIRKQQIAPLKMELKCISEQLNDPRENLTHSTAQCIASLQDRILQLEQERVPEGWRIVERNTGSIIVHKEKIGSCVVSECPETERTIPEAILWALAKDMLAAAPAQEKDNRPANCRNRLSDEGKTYPRSGCAHCKTGGITGCPFKKENSNG